MAARKKTNAKVSLGPMRTEDEVREAMDKVGSLPADNKLSDVSPEQIAKLSGAMTAQREPPLTMDDVVARHAESEESLPHGFRIVPPELPPERRDGPTMGPVKMIFDDPPDAPDESDERIRSLEDLMARFPFNRNRQDYFIRVARNQPKTYLGMTVTGVLRKIVEPLTYEQFVELYGGGEYELTVYGPPRGPGIMDPATGRLRPKALTRPITFIVPYDKEGVFGLAPNPSASIPEVDEAYPMESPMQKINMPDGAPHPFQRSMRVTTPSDASIHKTDLEYLRSKEKEEQERAEREEERRVSEREAELQLKLEEMRMRERQEARTVEISQEQARFERAQREELQRQLASGGSLTEVLRAVGVFKDDSSIKLEMARQAEAHKTELTRLMESHKDELSRREEEHRKDLDRERSLAEEKLRMSRDEATRERERTERMSRDVEERADRRAKDAEERAERRVEETRRDYERQLAAQKEIYESRLSDERRNNERDLASRKDSHDSRLQTEKATFEVQMKALEREVDRLRAEETRLRTELESKGDVVAQVQKVTEVATALGFTKANEIDSEKDEEEGPKDWKSLASSIGMNLVQNLPNMVRAAGDAVQAIRGQRDTSASASSPQMPSASEVAANGPQPAGARYGFRPRQRLTFATGDGELPGTSDYTPMLAAPPIYPTVQQPMAPPPPPPPPPYMPPQPTVVSTPPQAPSVMPPQPVMPSAPPPPTAVPAATPAAPQNEEQEIAAQILMFKPVLEQAVVNDADPVREVKQMVEQFGPEMVRTIAATITADRIIAVVSQAPDAASSPLLKFAGKKWLRAFEAAARAV